MSASAEPGSRQISARRRRTDKIMRGSLLVAASWSPRAARARHLLPDLQGASARGAGSSSRPTRTATSSAIPAGSAARSSVRSRSSLLATLIAVPLGIGVALYLVEYGKDTLVRELRPLPHRRDDRRPVDRLRTVHLHRARGLARRRHRLRRLEGLDRAGAADAAGRRPVRRGRAPAACPASLREAALALGAPRWRVVWSVVLPTARSGLVTGSLLAVARGMGETAPLLFTTAGAFALTFNLNAADERACRCRSTTTSCRPGRDRGSRVGHRARARDPYPDSEPDRSSRLPKEPHGDDHHPDDYEQATATGPLPGAPTCGRAPARAGAAGLRRPARSATAQTAPATPSASGANAYYGKQHALKDVSIEFPANEVTAIIGPSGCGKSTVVRCINRMHEEIPGARAEGEVTLDELDVYAPDVDVTVGAAADRDGVPEAQPVPDDVDLRQRRAGLRLTGTQERRPAATASSRSLQSVGLWDEVKDRLNEPGHRAVRRPAAAAVHRAHGGDRARGDPDGRALLRARPDRHAQGRGADRRAQGPLHDRDRHPQHAAGGARRRQSTVFMLDGEMIEHGATNDIFTNPRTSVPSAT